jgi:5-methylcytosine-specific restriction endonuclease McrA
MDADPSSARKGCGGAAADTVHVASPAAVPVACTLATARALVKEAVALTRRVLATAPPESLPRAAAHELACEVGTLEKLAAAATIRYARAAGKEAPLLLAAASGTAAGSARRRLDVARRISACAPLADAFEHGDLSVDQAGVLAPLAADPQGVEALVESASTLSMTALRAEAQRMIRRRRGERETARSERLLHGRRYCRAWTEPGGSVRLDARVGPQDGAALLAALQQEHEQLRRQRAVGTSGEGGQYDAAGAASVRADQLRADALVRLVTGKVAGRGLGRPELLIRVDAEALRRGEVADGETCEIAGIGPVSVGVASSVLGEALWTLLVTSGTDIRTVTTTTRVIPKKVRNALRLRDHECVVPGCGETEALEIDHWTRDFGRHGVTELDNLALVCRVHHAMKTRTGWRLLGGPGHWVWLAPKTVDELAEEHARLARGRAAGDDP